MLSRSLTPAQKKGPESRLIRLALKAELPFSATERFRLFHQPRMPTGFPDLVVAVYRSTQRDSQTVKQFMDVTDLKLLCHIYSVKKSTIPELQHKLVWKEKSIVAALTKLAKANLICINGRVVQSLSVRKIFVVSKIIAIEAKIYHWQKALEQASANRWFASHSYILIPETRTIARIAEAAKELGIGVLVFNGRSTRELVKPARYKIPSSYGSWLVNHWVMSDRVLLQD